MRFITAVGAWFACASMAMLDCVMIWLRVNCIISSIVVGVRTQQFQRQSGALDRLSEAVERLLHRLPLTGGEVERLAALGDRDLLACVNSRLAQRLDTNHARRGLRRA